MQNLVAPLSVSAPMSEAFSATQQVEQGDGSFAETFGENVPTADTAPQKEDDTAANYTGPMVWNGLLPAAPTFALVIGLATGGGVPGETAESGVEAAKGMVERGAIDTDTALPGLQQTDISNLSPVNQPPGEPRVGDAGHVGEQAPTVGIIAALLPASELADLASAAPADIADISFVTSDSVTPASGTAAIAPSVLTTEIANQDAIVLPQDISRPVKADPAAKQFAPVDGAQNNQVNPRQTPAVGTQDAGPVAIKVNPDGAEGSIIQDGDRFNPKAEEHGGFDSQGSAPAILRPITAQTDVVEKISGPVPLDQASSVLSDQIDGLQSSATLVDPVAATQATVVPLDQTAAPQSPTTSFWERSFSGPAALTRMASATAVDEPPEKTTTSSETAEVADEADSSDDPARPASALDKAPGSASSTTGTSLSGPHPGAASSYTGSPDVQSDAVDGFVSGGVLSGLDGNQGLLGRWHQSFDPLAMAATPNTPTGSQSGANGLQSLPVQHVASQLAAVLVRNASSVTELALAPEELGRVKLRMKSDPANPDRMVILISVDRPETLDLFRRHAGELADAIRNAGYSGADIGFDQSGGEGASGQRREPSSLAPALSFDDVDQTQATPMRSVGASLDLRL